MPNIETLYQRAFNNNGITSVTLGSSLRTIAANTFSDCEIQKIIIPEGCLTIMSGQYRSKNDTLRYVEIPSTVTDMDIFFHRSYENSSNESIYLVIKATTPPKMSFFGSGETVDSNNYRLNSLAGIYVPDSALSIYQDTTNLSNDQIGWKVAAVQAKLKPIS